jgi:hypothetical protein
MLSNSSLLILSGFLLLSVPLVAQDTPIGAPGMEVATQDTPAAAESTEVLMR